MGNDISTVSAAEVYYGSSGAKTRSYLSAMDKLGPKGRVASQLFRAQKASSRAKAYHGGLTNISYSDLAYKRKADALLALCEALNADSCGMVWGWRQSQREDFPPWVLYVELPQGQVSFHSLTRMDGPDYPGLWDQEYESEKRVIEFCDSVSGYAGPLREFTAWSTRPREQLKELKDFQESEHEWQQFEERERRMAQSTLNPDRLMNQATKIAQEEQVPKFGNTAKERIWRIIDDARERNATEAEAIADIRAEIVRTRIVQRGRRSLRKRRRG